MTGPVNTIAGSELFQRNMAALRRCDPDLASQIGAAAGASRLVLEPARKGGFTVRMPTPEGQAVYLHSRFDPLAEARRFAEGVAEEDTFCVVVCGVGLGYHVRALLDRIHRETVVLCIEPQIELIAVALACVDLAEPIAAGRLVFLTIADKHHLHRRLEPHGPRMMLGAKFVQHPPSMRITPEAHKRIVQAVTDFVNFTRTSLVTLVANSRITSTNIAMNLVHYVTTPPINLLRDRFCGEPAVVISAGPSLAFHLDQLASLKGRAVLCAVQTALKPLWERGIVPDFVTSLDYHEMSRKFFENVGDLSEVHLVAEPKATWHVLDPYPGPLSLLDNHWARMLLGDAADERDGLAAGATVAHLAFYLAVYMGCDPIIFVGQDLAFTGHVYYVPGVEIHRAWRGELNRFVSIEQKEWERIVRSRPILRRVPGNDGSELYSDELLVTYREQFERDIAAAARRVINATEAGARIHGTEAMPLRQATVECCTRPIDPARFGYRATTVWRDPSRLRKAAGQLRRRMAELKEVETVCDELIAELHELAGLTGDPQRFNRRMARVDKLRNRIDRNDRPYRVVSSFSQLAELRRFSTDRRIDAAGLDETEQAKRRITRDIEFAAAVRNAARDLRPILADALQRLEHPERV